MYNQFKTDSTFEIVLQAVIMDGSLKTRLNAGVSGVLGIYSNIVLVAAPVVLSTQQCLAVGVTLPPVAGSSASESGDVFGDSKAPYVAAGVILFVVVGVAIVVIVRRRRAHEAVGSEE